ncbi:hypothetical protein KC19_10G051500 [Ceratodon purpureus]|uniref:GDSL esterase/lipase n=1 Tax=Ceratodon purpureus TaxID=3225 RepID=A0A8T0GI99_CERPU|nr:hypothetical protein KC19_10G051500 [Ceratodon purpureus]
MEPRRMSLSRSWIKEQHFVLKHVAAILVLFSCAVTGAPNYNKIFVIGDSYQDNGNRDPNNNTRTVIGNVNQPWKQPYGRTAGSPKGRFSDGDKVLSDYLADSLGLKPRPYRVLGDNTQPTNVNDGVNFAVGGSGVFPNLGFTKTGDQIAQLQVVLNSGVGGPYTPTVRRKSLVFYGLAGNDYATFLRNNANVPLTTLVQSAITFAGAVVDQATKDLKALYNLGFRSFVVGKLPPLGCIPTSTFNASTGDYPACNEVFNLISTAHNTNLSLSLALALPIDAKIIYLNNQVAFSTVTYNLTNPGRLVPCCTGLQNGRLCGDVDEANNPQYTLCSQQDQGNFFFWDEFHPTQVGWKYLYNLYLDNSFFTSFPGGFPFYTYTDGKSLKSFLGV